MLDKSIPFIDVWMKREPQKPIPEYPLPPGYRFVFYQPGDEKDWARIETSVLEFACEMDALLYFQRTFLPYGPELSIRCLFVEKIEKDGNKKIATATAWWGNTHFRRDPLVHWVAAKPECQGQGIGKAIVARLIQLMVEIEGDRAFYLHTQTWSYKAIGIYEWAGFSITDEPFIQGRENKRYTEAAALLQELKNAR